MVLVAERTFLQASDRYQFRIEGEQVGANDYHVLMISLWTDARSVDHDWTTTFKIDSSGLYAVISPVSTGNPFWDCMIICVLGTLAGDVVDCITRGGNVIDCLTAKGRDIAGKLATCSVTCGLSP